MKRREKARYEDEKERKRAAFTGGFSFLAACKLRACLERARQGEKTAMSMSLMAKAMNIKVGNPLRKLVLIKLADNANDQGECWPSYQHIADQCEIGRSTVKNHIRALEDMGMLRREFRRNGDLNQSNLFYLTLNNCAE